MKKQKSLTCLTCGQPSEIGNYCRPCKRARADEQQRQRRARTCMTPGCKNYPSPRARLCIPCFVSIHPRQAAADARSGARPDVRAYMDERGMSYAKMNSRHDKPEEKEKRQKREAASQENRQGAGLVIYHGLGASEAQGKKKPPRRAYSPMPETHAEITAFINQLERWCCSRRYWLRRRFINIQTVPFWVADDGREFTACPGCGRAAN